MPTASLAARLGRDRGRLTLILVVLAAVLVPAWLLASSASRNDWDPTTWVVAGDVYAEVSRLPDGAVVLQGTGYDGQFYFALARDPLALEEATRAAIDTPAYRAQRLLLPGLGWVASGGGDPDALVWAIPLLDLAGGALIALAVALLARRRGASPLIGVAGGLVLGVVLATLRDLTEPLALGALALGVLARRSDRPWAWAVCATAAGLGRESLAAIVLAILIHDVVRRDRRMAAAGGIALALLAGWQLALWTHLGSLGVTSSGPGTLTVVPFGGMIDGVEGAFDALGSRAGLLGAAVALATVAGIAWGAWRAALARDDLAAAFVPSALLVVFSGDALWADVFAYGRAVAPLWIVLVMMAADRPRDGLARAVPALSVAVTLMVLALSGIPRIPGGL